MNTDVCKTGDPQVGEAQGRPSSWPGAQPWAPSPSPPAPPRCPRHETVAEQMGQPSLCPRPDCTPTPRQEPHPSTLIADSAWDAIREGLPQGPPVPCAPSQAALGSTPGPGAGPEGTQHPLCPAQAYDGGAGWHPCLASAWGVRSPCRSALRPVSLADLHPGVRGGRGDSTARRRWI